MALVEKYHSRVSPRRSKTVQYQRVFECLKGDMTHTGSGWAVTGLPSIGDDYPYGTWTLPPRCVSVDIDPRGRPGVGVITVLYTARVPLGGL